MYVTGSTNTIIAGRNIASTTWREASTATNSPSPLDASVVSSIYIKPDGYKIYFYDYGNNSIFISDLSAPWNISSFSNTQKISGSVPVASAAGSENTGLTFRPDGTQCYIFNNNKLYQANLSVPWNIDSATTWTLKVTLTGSGGAFSSTVQRGISISEDGSSLITCISASSGEDKLVLYTMSSPWEANSITHSSYVTSSNLSLSDTGISTDTIFGVEPAEATKCKNNLDESGLKNIHFLTAPPLEVANVPKLKVGPDVRELIV